MSKKSTTMTVKLIYVVLLNVIYTQANPIVQMTVEADENISINSDRSLPYDDAYYSDDYQRKGEEEELNSTNIHYSLMTNEISGNIDEDEVSKMILCMESRIIMLSYDIGYSIFDKNDVELVKDIIAGLCDSKE